MLEQMPNSLVVQKLANGGTDIGCSVSAALATMPLAELSARLLKLVF